MGLLDRLKKSSSASFDSTREVAAAAASARAAPTSSDDGAEDPASSRRPLHLGPFDFASPDDGNGSTSDRYPYPSLYAEADDMIKLSNLTYTLIELRELVRSGQLDDATHHDARNILEVPLPMERALRIVAEEAAMLREVLSDGAHEEALGALLALLGQKMPEEEGEGEEELDDGANGAGDANDEAGKSERPTMTPRPKELFGGLLDMWNGCFPTPDAATHELSSSSEYAVSTITAVGDANCQNELVYVAGINPAARRVTVAFRGSTTVNDFRTDARMDMVRVPDPRRLVDDPTKNTVEGAGVEEVEEVEENICVHQGFYEYLFGTTNNATKRSKFDEIMEHVQQLFDAHPRYRQEYKLYVTGHSLGGALATLFGFYASASPHLPHPISIISVASPRVGNLDFARAFCHSESLGRIRHLRIANHLDPVTLGPTVSHKRALTLTAMALSPLGYLALKLSGNDVGKEETYYHTGMKLTLRKDAGADGRRCEVSYSGWRFLTKEGDGEEADDDEEEEVAGGTKMKTSSRRSTSSLMGDQVVPLASYHFGSTYQERMAMVEDELEGMTLNGLYEDRAGRRRGT